MKLKTLRELTKDIAGNISIESENEYLVIFPKELRDEAIKWIKRLDQNILKSSDDGSCPHCSRRLERIGNDEYRAQIVWIQKFFNVECTCTPEIKGAFANCPIHSYHEIPER